MRRPLIIGNWKTTGSLADGVALLRELAAAPAPAVDVAVCPPFPLLLAARAELATTALRWGAQDAHWEASGAFTGAVSPRMLAEIGCAYALCGHSERRRQFLETDEVVGRKVAAVAGAGMTPVLCLGESEQERNSGRGEHVVLGQLMAGLAADAARQAAAQGQLVVAYEPIWAIGTGKAATPEDAGAMHSRIRAQILESLGSASAFATRILYGGSVTAANAGGFLGPESSEEIDGVLVGGASLRAAEFLAIAKAAGRTGPV